MTHVESKRHMANEYTILAGKSEELRLFRRPRRRWKDNIKMQLKKRLKTLIILFFSMVRQPLGGLDRLIFRGYTITLRHTTLGRTPLDE
jgi:hypothetical protein